MFGEVETSILIAVGVVLLLLIVRRRWSCHREKNPDERENDMKKKINENKLAQEISKREGKKVEVNIAQIKEVQRVLLEILAEYDDEQVLALIHKHRNRS